MENASKALLIATGLLLSVIIISLIVVTLTTVKAVSEEYDSKMNNNEINQFNTQFTKFYGKDIEIQDVMTLANLVASWNNNDNDEKITIELNGDSMLSVQNGIYKNKKFDELFISHNGDIKQILGTKNVQVPLYSISEIQYDNNGRVKSIKIVNATKYKIYED